MSKGIKIKWVVLIIVIMIALTISILAFPTSVQAKRTNFNRFYKHVECEKCETKSADPYSKLCAYGRCVMVCYKK